MDRSKEILKYPEEEHFYVQNGYVGNSILWWAKDGKGYTTNIDRAHKFTRQETLDNFVTSKKDYKPWPASHIEENISMHVNAEHVSTKFRIE